MCVWLGVCAEPSAFLSCVFVPVLALQGYKPPEEGPGEYQTIPLDKIEDFGVHCKEVGRPRIIAHLPCLLCARLLRHMLLPGLLCIHVSC